MADAKTTITELIDHMAEFVAKRDWQQFHSPKNLVMGLAVETAELMEHFLWLSNEQSCQVVNDSEQMTLIREELADVLSFLLALAKVLEVDLSDAFYDKMKKNDDKYPQDKYYGRYKI